MDIKELIEKAFAVGHTIGYGNTENHYKPEFERWWNDENTQKQVKNCSIPDVSVRYFFAANALKAEIESWNAEMSDEHRAKLLEDMIDRHGETTVCEALAKNAFEMADAMLHAR